MENSHFGGPPIAVAAAILAGVGGLWFGSDKAEAPSLSEVYERSFTSDGDCLDGTIFDPDEGADTVPEAIEGQPVLNVRPRAAGQVLHFTVGHNQTLQFADFKTAGTLDDKGCSLPGGM